MEQLIAFLGGCALGLLAIVWMHLDAIAQSLEDK